MGATSLRSAVDEVFGRWPVWPWSVLGLIVVGGAVGLVVGAALVGTGEESRAALGKASCAGYGLVVAATLTLLPRVGKLAFLRSGVARRPANVDGTWWPLKLLAPAIAATPKLRRTQQEFRSAVATAAGQARSLLADRLWPAWVVAFVAPVLGLITAWQNGAKVQLRLQQGDEMDVVFPAFIAQVSPPMVATIAASLALMVAIIVIDQSTKALLQRWSGIVEASDGEHQSVIDRLGQEEFLEPSDAPRPPVGTEARMQRKRDDEIDPDELDEMWRRSSSRDA
ncbi:MAG: hypothetical protein ACKO6B_04270 [Planctomycetia bacterium]